MLCAALYDGVAPASQNHRRGHRGTYQVRITQNAFRYRTLSHDYVDPQTPSLSRAQAGSPVASTARESARPSRRTNCRIETHGMRCLSLNWIITMSMLAHEDPINGQD